MSSGNNSMSVQPWFSACLVLLMLSGLVLASSTFIEWPTAVWASAFATLLLGLIGSGILGWRRARADGVGFFRTVGRSLREMGRFVVDFF